MANSMNLLPKLTVQEANDIVFALKRFNCEKYERLHYDDVRGLMFVKLDDIRAAMRLWGTASSELLHKLNSA
jgi:hypothetical protein